MALPASLKEKYKENLVPTKDAVEEARAVLAAAREAGKKERAATKHDNWTRLSEARLAKLLKSLKTFGNLGRAQYSYSQEEAGVLMAKIRDGVENLSRHLGKRFQRCKACRDFFLWETDASSPAEENERPGPPARRGDPVLSNQELFVVR